MPVAAEFAPVAVGPAFKLLLGALDGVPWWFDPDGPPAPGALSAQVVDLLLTALAGR